MSLRIHYLQHVTFEDLDAIAGWAAARGHTTRGSYRCENLPELHDFDWLIIMGGPMGVADEERYPWLVEEKRFIRAAIDAGKTVVGICLGSQLIAEVLGATVRPGSEAGTEKEIGWWPISKTDQGRSHPLLAAMPDEMTVFHWHGDTWSLPEGATLLASSAGCPSQAFVYGDRVVGLQFHFEATPQGVDTMVARGSGALDTSHPFIQSAEQIAAGSHHAEGGNRVLFALLDQLAKGESRG